MAQAEKRAFDVDANGNLSIIKASTASLESLMSSHSQTMKNVKFRHSEKKVVLFEHFVI
jgi:type IV secretory pathway VirB9-like protein